MGKRHSDLAASALYTGCCESRIAALAVPAGRSREAEATDRSEKEDGAELASQRSGARSNFIRAHARRVRGAAAAKTRALRYERSTSAEWRTVRLAAVVLGKHRVRHASVR